MSERYDRRAAAAYALKYALHYNPAWPSYKGEGGDCTNFVSQALYAGGWTMIKNEEVSVPKWSSLSWYCSRSDYHDQSRTWSNATDFSYFLGNNLAARARQCSPSELDVGDIVQLRGLGDSGVERVHHTTIVTGVLPTSLKRSNFTLWGGVHNRQRIAELTKQVFVTYHTTDVQQTVLATLAMQDQLICWKVRDFFESPDEDSDSGGPSLYEP